MLDRMLIAVIALLSVANCFVAVPLLRIEQVGAQFEAVPDIFTVLLVLLGTLCLLWRHRAPLTILGIAVVAHCSYLALGFPPARPLAPVIALIAVAEETTALVAAATAGVVALSVIFAAAAELGWEKEDFDDRVLDNLMLLIGACLLGYGVQLSRARSSVLLAQQQRLDREHSTAQERAIRSEKSRIAHELHDIVSHHISVITAQAAGAQQVFDRNPELARGALGSIETAGRGALTEMRRLLGVLEPGAPAAELAPQPNLSGLPALREQIEAAGLPVTIRVHGRRRELPPGVELNAYRIAQEALTNTLKHAGPAGASVDVEYRATSLELRIVDTGVGFTPQSTTGHGLLGMHQRAELLGGRLSVDRGADGGVAIHVSLPVEPAESTTDAVSSGSR